MDLTIVVIFPRVSRNYGDEIYGYQRYMTYLNY